MSKNVLKNKTFLMNNTFNRKKMYKSGKQWMVANALVLALLGGGAVAGHTATTHAANVNQSAQAHVVNPSTVKSPVTSNSNSGSASANDVANDTAVKARNLKNQIANQVTKPASSASISHGSGAERVTEPSQASSASESSSASSNATRPKMMLGGAEPSTQNTPKAKSLSENAYLEDGSAYVDKFGISGTNGETFTVVSSANNQIDAVASNGQTIGSYAIPSNFDFKLASSKASFAVKPYTSGLNIIQVTPISDTDATTSDKSDIEFNNNIPIKGNVVYFKGNIVLHFPEGKNEKTVTVKYDIPTSVNQSLADILNNGNPDVAIPDSYANKVISDFNTANYTYDKNNTSNASSSTYDGINITPSDGENNSKNHHVTFAKQDSDGNNEYDYNNDPINFYFTANPMNEYIHYQYKSGANTFNENSGSASQVISGPNNSSSDVTSSIASSANASGALKPGWHISSGANTNFIYGNSGSDASKNANDNINVPVSPNSASATINYVVSDSNATNNSSSSTKTVNGNSAAATDAGSNDYVISNPTNTGSSANSNGVPAGYHVMSGQNKTIPYDNQSHTVKIQGNMHNGDNSGKAKPSTTSTTPPNTTNPNASNYVPKSDVVAVYSQKFSDGGTPEGSDTTYVTESGRTGESYQIKPSDYEPNGYKTKEEPYDQTQTGTFTANGVNLKNITFRYKASQGSTINVNFIDQSGYTVQTEAINQDVDDTGNVIKNYGIPAGYHFVRASDKGGQLTSDTAQDVGYKVSTNTQTINIHITGNTYTPSSNNGSKGGGSKPTPPASDTKPNHFPPKPSSNKGKGTKPNNGGGKKKQKPNSSDNGKDPQGNPDKPNSPQDAKYTFYVTVNDFPSPTATTTTRSYQIKLVETGTVGNSFHVDYDNYSTNGYTPDSSDQNYTGHFGASDLLDNSTPRNKRDSVVWNFYATPQTGYINYVDQNGNSVQKSVPINGHTDETVNVTNNNGKSTIPSGYHANTKGNNSNYKYHFNGPSDNPSHPDNDGNSTTYQIQGNTIKGTATLNLNYENASDKVISHISDRIPINGQVGDSDMEIIPLDYDRTGYTNSDQIWSIPFKSSIAPKGDNNNYTTSHTFTYKADDEASLNIEYVDVDPNAMSDGHGKVTFGKNTYPIVSDQVLHNIGRIGQTVNLIDSSYKGAKNLSASDRAVLQAPDGYHLVHKDSNKRIVPMRITLKKSRNIRMILMSFGGSARPITPSNNSSANKPASKASSATSSKASSGSAIKPNSANSSVAPSASGKTTSGSASAKSSASVKPSNASGTSANSSANVKPSANSSANSSANAKSGNSASSAIPSGNSSSANSAQSSNVVPSASSATPSSVQPEFIITPNNSGSVAPSASASNTSASGSVASASDNNTANTSDVAPTNSASDTNTETNSDIPVLKNNTQPNTQPESDNIINPDNVVTPSNVVPSDNNVVNDEPTNAQSPIFSSVPSDNEALANNTVATPNNNTATGKLPQTNESTNYAGITAMVALMLGIGLAGVDLKRRYE